MGFSLAQGHDWFNLIEVLLFVVGSGIASVFAAKIANRNASKPVQGLTERVDAIAGHVANGHTEPLRADVDRLLQGQELAKRSHAEMLRLLIDTHSLVVQHSGDIGDIRDAAETLKDRVDKIATPTRRTTSRAKKDT